MTTKKSLILMTVLLFVALIAYALFFTTTGHRVLSGRLLKPDTVYIQHKAPDNSFLGQYENVKGPIRIDTGVLAGGVIEKREMALDSTGGIYYANGKGYRISRKPDGTIVRVPLTLQEVHYYNLYKPDSLKLAVHTSNSLNTSTDALFVSSLKTMGTTSALLYEKLRGLTDTLYRFTINGMEYKVDAVLRAKDTTVTPTVFTTILMGNKHLLNKKDSLPFILLEKRSVAEFRDPSEVKL